MRLELCGEALELDPAGLLHWPERGLVVVADLHLEKGSAFARRGLMLPPYDTHATLLRLEAVLERLRPRTVVSLGDSFHDRRGAELLEPELARQVRRLTGSVEWVWVRGNHDPDPPAGLGGRAVAELSVAGLLFRHAPCGEAGEVAGHLHPKARLVGTRLRLSRPCYVSDGLAARAAGVRQLHGRARRDAPGHRRAVSRRVRRHAAGGRAGVPSAA